jgi:hypothetical protein
MLIKNLFKKNNREKMKSNRLIKFKDGFYWWDLTNEAEDIYKSIELYVLFDDESELLVESIEEIHEAIANNLRIAMKMGYVGERPDLWTKCQRYLRKGHWYIKLSDALKTLS